MLARLILPMDWTDGTAKRTGIVNPCLSGLASRARSFSPAGDPTFSILNTFAGWTLDLGPSKNQEIWPRSTSGEPFFYGYFLRLTAVLTWPG